MMTDKPAMPGSGLLKIYASAFEYRVDSGQRSVLFMDVMRRPGEQYREHLADTVLDRPLALDNAIDAGTAMIKDIKSEVAERAQLLVLPDFESGDMLAKNLAYFAKADGAGIVLRARVPIVLTSRADSLRARMASCAVAALYAEARRRRAAVAA